MSRPPGLRCIADTSWPDARQLCQEHPARLQDARKAALFELGLSVLTSRPITCSRWTLPPLSEELCLADPASTQLVPLASVYEYPEPAPEQTLTHVNFANTKLFGFYGSSLFAQDEVQVAEHPVLASVREACAAAKDPGLAPLTRYRQGASTPVLVSGADRCLRFDTRKLYGPAFCRATEASVLQAAMVLKPPTTSNILVMAAPDSGHGSYSQVQITDVLHTALCGFAAACSRSQGRCILATGHWGCGVFGGNQTLMCLLQLAAARLAGVHELRYYAFDSAGLAAVQQGAQQLEQVWEPGLSLPAFVQRVHRLGFQWGASTYT